MYDSENDHIKKIKALSEKMGRIEFQVHNEHRAPTGREVGLCVEIEAAINEERKYLTDKPITLENTFSNSGIIRGNGPFENLGEQLRCVALAGMPGQQPDQRLFAAASGTNESVPSDGGFLVQQDFSSEIITSAFQTGQLAKLCRRITISGNSNGIKINGIDEKSRVAASRYGGVQGYWTEEAGLLTATKPKFRQINLELKKLIGLCYATDELISDTAALNQVIGQAFISELGFLLDDAIINGTGAGQPLGILNADCLVSVGKETGQKAATVVAENVFKMKQRLLASSGGQSGVWLINQNVEAQLYQMSLSVGTGGVPVYMPAGGISGQPYNSLFGMPVIVCEQCPTLGTQGDIMLCDLANGYILAEKGGVKADMSIHVRFIYDESVFRFVMRVDGQPILASAITPYKGGASDTQSHFISLATRA